MKLTDRRLYQARTLEDFRFRLAWREKDNFARRGALREKHFYVAQTFVAPDTERIFGTDTSDWDGNCNFQVFRDYGGRFVIIKAIDGTVPMRYWQANNQRAIAAGLFNGAYAWLYPNVKVSCRAQAESYWALIKNALLQLPPAIDFEWTRYAGQSANPNYDDLDKWATAFNAVSGTKAILYSAAGYMNMFGVMPDSLRRKFAGFWFASYPSMTFPRGFTSWDIHQFTANGDALALCPGDRGKLELDLNYMQPEFYERYGGAIVPPPEQPGGTMFYGRVNTSVLNVRQGPGASYMDLGDLLLNDHVIATEKVGGWWRLSAARRGSWTGADVALSGGKTVAQRAAESNDVWCSGAYVVEVDAPTEPPAPPPVDTFPAEIGVTIGTVTKQYVPKP